MSISVRAAHVLSIMLIVAFASNAAGWTRTQRSAGHCTQHTSCTPSASLSCCGPTAPTPVDPFQPPHSAMPLVQVSPSPLMDLFLPASAPHPSADVTSPHWLRLLDLAVLHHTLII